MILSLPTPKQVPEDSTTSSQSTHNVDEIYEAQFEKWLCSIRDYYDGRVSRWPITHQHFVSVFLPSVQMKLELKVIFDKSAATALLNFAKKLNIIVFKFEPDLLYADISKIKQVFQQHRWVIIIKIAELLSAEQFIPNSALQKIRKLYNLQTSLENRLQEFYSTTLSNNKHISLTAWNEKIGIHCKSFWTNIIYQWPISVKRSDVMKKVFLLFQGYLNSRLSRLETNNLKILFGLQKIQIIEQIASLLCLFSYPKKVKQMNNHLELLKHKIRTYFEESVKKKKIVNFEIYGSFRSRICLESSDIDVTVFVENEHGVISENREFVCQTMLDIYSAVKWIATFQNEQINVDKTSIFSVVNHNIKVPFVRFRFDSQMPIQSMDMVVNNVNGVRNSMILEKYSQNIFIRNLGVVVKKWAKKNKLISPQRMSSYGLTLLMLYFLMCEHALSFPTLDELTAMSFSIETRKSNLLASLIGFFRFYLRRNQFNQNRQIACIVKNCSDHNSIMNYEFVFNIHDPFDGTNPGRLKQRDELLFFQCVEQALQILEEANKLAEIDQGPILQNLLGLDYESIQECA